MTRSLWVTNDFPPRAGGIEQFLANLLAGCEPDDVAVLAAGQPGDAAHDAALPYAVTRSGRRPLLPSPRLARQLRAAVEAHRAEVVVFGAAWPLGELGSAVDVPTLALTHGHEAGMSRVGLGPLIGRVARRVDALGVISAFTATALGPWASDTPLVPVHPGVDVQTFTPTRDGGDVRRRGGVPADAALVVCVSRLVARKGQDVLVEAWPAVRAAIPGARLLLAGSGPGQRAIRRRVAELHLTDAVALTGPVAWSELPAHHAAGDVFAMPCRTRLGGLDVEGLGIVYLEAQACGVPVVAGASGGAPSALQHDATGLVVNGRSPPQVAEGLIALLGDPERRARMGRAARAFVEERFAWPVVHRKLGAVLDALAAGRALPLRPRPEDFSGQ